MDEVQLSQGYSHFEEAVYFLPFSSQKFLVLILSTSEGWKGWVDLGATQRFWTRDPWIGNPAPQPLGHCSITTLETTQKWLTWTGGCLVKHLHKTTTNQIWSFLVGFQFHSHCECSINNKRFAAIKICNFASFGANLLRIAKYSYF